MNGRPFTAPGGGAAQDREAAFGPGPDPDLDRLFGRGRVRMVTGRHVEVFREPAHPGERRRYTKRFLATDAGDFRAWTEREWRILARLVGHGIACVPEVARFDRGGPHEPAIVQTYDAGITVDHWGTLLPVQRAGRRWRHVFEDCAHWWALARQLLLALDAVHELRLVHLDLKPDNVCVPTSPADFDPAAPGQLLRPRFEQLALIDFAFSLVCGDPLATALPLARQPDYDYQSPRLLAALHASRQGDLRPTRELDWRCDFYSLAALLARYLPDAHTPAEAGWTAARLDQALALLHRLRAIHDGELPARRPHADLADDAALLLRDAALADSLAQGWMADGRGDPTDLRSPTPITRVAQPLAATPAPTLAATPAALGAPPHRPPPEPRRRWPALAAGAAALVLAVPLLAEAWKTLADDEDPALPPARLAAAPEAPAVPRAAPTPAAHETAAPDRQEAASATADPAAGSGSASASAPTQAAAETAAHESPDAAPPPAESPAAAAASTASPAAASAPTEAAVPATAPPPPTAAPPTATAQNATPTTTPPPAAAPPLATLPSAATPPGPRRAGPAPSATVRKEPSPAGRPAQAQAQTERRGHASARQRAAPVPAPSSAARATATPRPGTLPQTQTPKTASTERRAWLEPRAAARAIPVPVPVPAPAPAAATRPPPTLPPPAAEHAVLRPLPPTAAATPAAPTTTTAPAPMPPATRPAVAETPRDLQARADGLLAGELPRIAERAERLVLRVLFAAGRGDGAHGDDEIRQAATTLRLGPAEPLAVLSTSEARLLDDAAQQAQRRGDLPAAIELMTRAFAANPLDADIAGDLAALRLRASSSHAAAARQLALHALTTPHARHPHGRLDDWTTLAIANALTGRERDARHAWYVTLALAPNADRLCRIALNAYVRHGERVRPSIDALLQRAEASGRATRSASCEWPPRWAGADPGR